MNSVNFLVALGIILAYVPLRRANILRMFQEEPPIPKYRYSPQFLQHTEAGKNVFFF